MSALREAMFRTRLRSCVLAAAACAASFAGVDRPRDPWVMRGAVDGVESAVTLALHAELWVSYDARWCSLHGAWSGRGSAERTVDVPAARRLDGADGAVWWLVQHGEARLVEARWLGYVLRDGQATLRYEMRCGDARMLVEETPELVRPADLADDPSAIAPWVRADMLGLRRTFHATGVPDGAQLCLTLSDRVRGGVVVQELADLIEEPCEGEGCRRWSARMPLVGAEAWNELIYFFAAPDRVRARK